MASVNFRLTLLGLLISSVIAGCMSDEESPAKIDPRIPPPTEPMNYSAMLSTWNESWIEPCQIINGELDGDCIIAKKNQVGKWLNSWLLGTSPDDVLYGQRVSGRIRNKIILGGIIENARLSEVVVSGAIFKSNYTVNRGIIIESVLNNTGNLREVLRDVWIFRCYVPEKGIVNKVGRK